MAGLLAAEGEGEDAVVLGEGCMAFSLGEGCADDARVDWPDGVVAAK